MVFNSLFSSSSPEIRILHVPCVIFSYIYVFVHSVETCDWVLLRGFLLKCSRLLTNNSPTSIQPTSSVIRIKNRKNWECCPVSLLIIRSQRLSWIQVINYKNCNQCLKGHKSLGLSLSLSKLSKIVSKLSKKIEKLSEL